MAWEGPIVHAAVGEVLDNAEDRIRPLPHVISPEGLGGNPGGVGGLPALLPRTHAGSAVGVHFPTAALRTRISFSDNPDLNSV